MSENLSTDMFKGFLVIVTGKSVLSERTNSRGSDFRPSDQI